MSNLRVAVVGCGYWGQNLLRNFCELEDAEVVLACDFDVRALSRTKRRYPTLEVTQSTRTFLPTRALKLSYLPHRSRRTIRLPPRLYSPGNTFWWRNR